MTTDPPVLKRCAQWAAELDRLNLRIEAQGDGEWTVQIGTLGYQAIELSLWPEQQSGELESSQSVFRYAEQRVCFTTPWDDEWTDCTPEGGLTLVEWTESSLGKLIARHLDWEVESALEDPLGGGALDSLAHQLQQVEAFGAARAELSPLLLGLMALSGSLIRAYRGDASAAKTVIDAIVDSPGALDDPESVCFLLIAAGSWSVPEEHRALLVQRLAPRLEAETRRIAERYTTEPHAFRPLKHVIDTAAPPIAQCIARCLEDLMQAHEPDNPEEREVLKQIQRYQALHRDWQCYRPSASDPLAEGEVFLELEAAINRHWRGHLDREQGLTRDAIASQLTQDGRFLSGASTTVLGWMRDQHLYDAVVERFCAQMLDVELLELQYRSQQPSFECLVNNALGAFLDSGVEVHIDRAMACVDTLETFAQWQGRDVLYQIACVLSRAGHLDRALASLEAAVDRGASMHHILRDTDLAAVRTHPDFDARFADQ